MRSAEGRSRSRRGRRGRRRRSRRRRRRGRRLGWSVLPCDCRSPNLRGFLSSRVLIWMTYLSWSAVRVSLRWCSSAIVPYCPPVYRGLAPGPSLSSAVSAVLRCPLLSSAVPCCPPLSSAVLRCPPLSTAVLCCPPLYSCTPLSSPATAVLPSTTVPRRPPLYTIYAPSSLYLPPFLPFLPFTPSHLASDSATLTPTPCRWTRRSTVRPLPLSLSLGDYVQ